MQRSLPLWLNDSDWPCTVVSVEGSQSVSSSNVQKSTPKLICACVVMDATLAMPEDDDEVAPDHGADQAIQVGNMRDQRFSIMRYIHLLAIVIGLRTPWSQPTPTQILSMHPAQAGLLHVIEDGQVVAEEPLYLGTPSALLASIFLSQSRLTGGRRHHDLGEHTCSGRSQYHRTTQLGVGAQRAAAGAVARRACGSKNACPWYGDPVRRARKLPLPGLTKADHFPCAAQASSWTTKPCPRHTPCYVRFQASSMLS